MTESTFPNASLIAGFSASDWNQSLRALALAAPDDIPSIAVIDEVPWLIETNPEFEGALQTVWDRHLSAKPLLLILIGSDISIMRALQEHGRPFFGRASKFAVNPLNPADVHTATGLNAADAIDARLITGGFPEIVQSWERGMTRDDFLAASLANPLAPLLMSGELTLSAKPDTRNKRYRIEDSYLRFWLSFLQRGLPQIERGRSDLVAARIAFLAELARPGRRAAHP